MEILVQHQTSDRHSHIGTETGILHEYGDSDLRIMIRCEAHENGVILTMRILGRSGLSAHLDIRKGNAS